MTLTTLDDKVSISTSRDNTSILTQHSFLSASSALTCQSKSTRLEKSHLVYYDHEQGSLEWIEARNKFITASAIGTILNGPQTAGYRNLLAEKASDGQHRTFFGSDATRWGHKYEPVADMLFEYRNPGVEIYEYGLVHNPNYPYLGVSPDGITNKNEMLEIKCPYSRKIDGKIKNEYAHQIQQQLLVCEHEICNFLECKFVEVAKTHFWNIFSASTREKGVIIQSLEEGERFNYYSPIELGHNQTDLQDWYNYRLEDIEAAGGTVVKETYWLLDQYNCQKVKRDPTWYQRYRSNIEKFWLDVENTRREGWEHLVKKKTVECLLP